MLFTCKRTNQHKNRNQTFHTYHFPSPSTAKVLLHFAFNGWCDCVIHLGLHPWIFHHKITMLIMVVSIVTRTQWIFFSQFSNCPSIWCIGACWFILGQIIYVWELLSCAKRGGCGLGTLFPSASDNHETNADKICTQFKGPWFNNLYTDSESWYVCSLPLTSNTPAKFMHASAHTIA
jgi:hypothetical protein